MSKSNRNFLQYLNWIKENWDVFQPSERPERPTPKHPGVALAEELRKANLSQTKLARMLDCTHAKVNEIINGKRNITPEFALQLEKALGISAEFWISIQSAADLHKARQK